VTSTQTASSNSVAARSTNALLNQETNGLANSGGGGTSTGSADSTSAEQMVPLSAIAHYGPGNTPLAVNHQGTFAAATISFNLTPGASLTDAVAAIRQVTQKLGVPADIHGSFQGTARAFQQSLSNEPLLILAALVAVYIVLGVLYESYIHPVTILSTLPSAGTGAVLALILFKADFSIIALIGMILLIGIVKKNAIMMIDFALEQQRSRGLSPRDAIYQASLLRFRPIMMTTFAAMLGALPLAFGHGDGAEIRQPLGISIVGGLIVSQVLTLYTTPAMYLYLDQFGAWCSRLWARLHSRPAGGHAAPAQ
jgi:multidrug efflux pump